MTLSRSIEISLSGAKKKFISRWLISGVWTPAKCQIMRAFGNVLCHDDVSVDYARHRRPRISQWHTRETWSRASRNHLSDKEKGGCVPLCEGLFLVRCSSDNNLISVDNSEIRRSDRNDRSSLSRLWSINSPNKMNKILMYNIVVKVTMIRRSYKYNYHFFIMPTDIIGM